MLSRPRRCLSIMALIAISARHKTNQCQTHRGDADPERGEQRDRLAPVLQIRRVVFQSQNTCVFGGFLVNYPHARLRLWLHDERKPSPSRAIGLNLVIHSSTLAGSSSESQNACGEDGSGPVLAALWKPAPGRPEQAPVARSG